MTVDQHPLPDMHLDDPASFDGIALQKVSKRFGDKVVLEEADLTIRRGETIVVIGRSGMGKSVMLKNIVRLLEPDAGEIWVEGVAVTRLDRSSLMDLRKRFGMLFQGAALFDSFTICENVGLILHQHTDWSPQRIRARACECLEMVGLKGTEDKLPSALSGGMRKRAGLARAIVFEPQYILYDEPTTGLDPITADAINDLIVKLQRELTVTSVVVTHDLQSAYKIGDRIAMLHQGKIVHVEDVATIQQTEHPVVRQFLEGRADGPLDTF